MALGDSGGPLCEARFAHWTSQQPWTVSPSPRPGRDVFSRLAAETLVAGQPACSAGSCTDQQNSVPSIHILCMMTASLRATATRALLRLVRFAMRIPQAFREDHLETRVSS